MRTSIVRHGLTTVHMLALAVVAAAALVVTPLLTTAAHAAYPEMSCTVSVTPQQINSGEAFTVSGQSPSATSWSVEYNGKTDVYSGTDFSHTYKAPVTAKDKTVSLSAKCIGVDGAGQTQFFDLQILGSERNAAGGTDGALANTGGFSVWWLVAGAGALVVGSGLIVAGRRRRPTAE